MKVPVSKHVNAACNNTQLQDLQVASKIDVIRIHNELCLFAVLFASLCFQDSSQQQTCICSLSGTPWLSRFRLRPLCSLLPRLCKACKLLRKRNSSGSSKGMLSKPISCTAATLQALLHKSTDCTLGQHVAVMPKQETVLGEVAMQATCQKL